MKKIIFIFLISFFAANISFGQTAVEILTKMVENTKKVNAWKFHFLMSERVKGEYIKTKYEIKQTYKPFQVYMKKTLPEPAAEVLYVAGTNDGNALVNPNSFPYVNLNLDPKGAIMRDKAHHTLLETGFLNTAILIESTMKKYATNIEKMVKIENSNATFDGKSCYKIVLENPNFRYIEYSVKSDETVSSIAAKLKVNDYMILEKNPSISGFDDFIAGNSILVPSDYAKKMVILVDKERFIPLQMFIYDDIGLYEQYEFTQVVVNAIFKSNEFTKDFEGYGF